jgi:hypothetical protein
MSDPLKHLAQRVEGDPSFLASLLAEYARSEGLDDGGLARELSCQAEDLTGIRLCRTPRPDPDGCWDDVRRIAERFSFDAARLLEIVRQAEAMRRLREGGTSGPGFLMAARDRPDEAPQPEQGKRP